VTAQPEVRAEGSAAACGGWTADAADGVVEVQGDGEPADWWRAVAVAAWAALDETGEPADTTRLAPPGPAANDG
jgi:hypothetical protein